jgi:hypothetical protein
MRPYLFHRLTRRVIGEPRTPVRDLTKRECRAIDFAYGALAALSMVCAFAVIFLLLTWRPEC